MLFLEAWKTRLFNGKANQSNNRDHDSGIVGKFTESFIYLIYATPKYSRRVPINM